jgi:hypothetical protein
MKYLIFVFLLAVSCQSKQDKIALMESEIDSLKVKAKSFEQELAFETDWAEKTGNRQSVIDIETKIFNIGRSIDSINSEIINLRND